jgi:VWFA-related protein
MGGTAPHLRAFLFCWLLATDCTTVLCQQAGPTAPAAIPTTPITGAAATLRFLAVSQDGDQIPTLRAEDLSLRVNNEARKIVSLVPANGEPRTFGLFFDVSGSRQSDTLLAAEVQSAGQFLNTIWRDGDLAFVITFSAGASALLKPTHELKPIQDALQMIPKIKNIGPTAIYDALCAVHLGPQSDNREKIFIVVSDFGDNSSRKSSDEMIKAMQKEGIRVFVLLRTDWEISAKVAQENTSKKIADKTGGEVFPIIERESLDLAFHRLASELNGAYRLAYDAPPTAVAPKNQQLSTTRPNVRLLFAKD